MESQSMCEGIKNMPSTACLHCKKEIIGKPWISVQTKNGIVYGCSYTCSSNLKCYIGSGYWKDVINKEDFNEPRPVINSSEKENITFDDLSEIKKEILEEEERVRKIEEDYENYSSDYSDEENFE